MATIFLSYRRTDSPQACRVYDWLGQRFGYDAIFMDVAAIPFAVSFPDFIKQAIENSKILIALIGAHWQTNIRAEDDPVRMEIEVAIANHIPLLPVLIGNTPMPDISELPASISAIASQNAITVGVLHDFNTHMQALLPKIEAILGALAATSLVHSDPHLIEHACDGIISYLKKKALQEQVSSAVLDGVIWVVVNNLTMLLRSRNNTSSANVTLYLHRVTRLAESVELHFILSFWAFGARWQHGLAGWVMSQLERNPVVPDEFFTDNAMTAEFDLKIRWSDEDARQVWKMITDEPLQLSLAYVATLSPKRRKQDLSSIPESNQE